MMKPWKPIILMFALACMQYVPALAENKISADIASVLRRPALNASQVGVAFYDLDKGSMLYERDSGKYFVAASTTKVLTESTTLAILGPNYRFTTNVYRNGSLDSSGTVHGDVVLRASGDPNL